MTLPPSLDTAQAAEVYAATFAGRHDVYSIYLPAEGDRPAMWNAVRKPLTGEMVLRAFQTGVPISAYFLDRDTMTHLAALDIDREDGMELGTRFMTTLTAAGGIGYLEPSRRGCHVWMVLSEQRPGIVVRWALRALIEESGIGACPGEGKPSALHPKTNQPVCPECHRSVDRGKVEAHFDVRVEVRPASDRLGEAKEGEPFPVDKCLRMPTMPHPSSGKRWALISSDGEKLGDKLTEFMLEIDYCPVKVFDDASERAPLPPLASPGRLANPYRELEEDTASASELLRDLWGATGRLVPGKATKCPAHDDHRPTLLIFRGDDRVKCYSPGCILAGDHENGRGTAELRKLAPRP